MNYDDMTFGSNLTGAIRGSLGNARRLLEADTKRDLRNMRDSLRLFVVVIFVAACMGIAAWAFLASLDIATKTREAHRWIFAFMPVVGVGTAWIYRNHGLAAKRGNNLVIDSALSERLIHARMAILTFICSTLTHLTGGSAGREGAAVQIGGTIASNVSHALHLNEHDHHDLMLAGISAAFGSVFGAPLAGAFFGMEMCFVGKIDYTAGVYCLAASFAGYLVSLSLGTTYEAHVIHSIPALSPTTVTLVVCAAVAFGCTARLFAWLIRKVKMFYGARFKSYLLAACIGAFVVLGVYAILGAWNYAGLSTWLVDAGFEGSTSIIDAAIKLLVTALTLGAGFQGGEVTPLFGIGAALGGWFGTLAGQDPSFMAALGMLGVFCAGLNVPLTTVMMSIDLFGGQGAAYFVIVAFMSYLVAGHRGVYPAQRIVMPKRRSLTVDQGGTVGDAIKRHAALSKATGNGTDSGNVTGDENGENDANPATK